MEPGPWSKGKEAHTMTTKATTMTPRTTERKRKGKQQREDPGLRPRPAGPHRLKGDPMRNEQLTVHHLLDAEGVCDCVQGVLSSTALWAAEASWLMARLPLIPRPQLLHTGAV